MSNRPRIIERSEDDLVVGWKWEQEVACFGVFVVVVVLMVLSLGRWA